MEEGGRAKAKAKAIEEEFNGNVMKGEGFSSAGYDSMFGGGATWFGYVLIKMLRTHCFLFLPCFHSK